MGEKLSVRAELFGDVYLAVGNTRDILRKTAMTEGGEGKALEMHTRSIIFEEWCAGQPSAVYELGERHSVGYYLIGNSEKRFVGVFIPSLVRLEDVSRDLRLRYGDRTVLLPRSSSPEEKCVRARRIAIFKKRDGAEAYIPPGLNDWLREHHRVCSRCQNAMQRV